MKYVALLNSFFYAEELVRKRNSEGCPKASRIVRLYLLLRANGTDYEAEIDSPIVKEDINDLMSCTEGGCLCVNALDIEAGGRMVCQVTREMIPVITVDGTEVLCKTKTCVSHDMYHTRRGKQWATSTLCEPRC